MDDNPDNTLQFRTEGTISFFTSPQLGDHVCVSISNDPDLDRPIVLVTTYSDTVFFDEFETIKHDEGGARTTRDVTFSESIDGGRFSITFDNMGTNRSECFIETRRKPVAMIVCDTPHVERLRGRV